MGSKSQGGRAAATRTGQMRMHAALAGAAACLGLPHPPRSADRGASALRVRLCLLYAHERFEGLVRHKPNGILGHHLHAVGSLQRGCGAAGGEVCAGGSRRQRRLR